MSNFATREEIKHAYTVLFKKEENFEEDKIKIIECNESRDIKACPGSGKTTTLLAKLVILANRMPLPNNQGICVLTHTNVAMDEIKQKLGNKADILFKYPNHFGTIQSFVDKFLAIPYFSIAYHKKPSQISNDAYIKNLNRSFKMRLGQLKKSNEPLQKRMWNFFLSNDGLLNNIRLGIKDSEYQLINISDDSEIKFNKPRKGKNYTDWSNKEKEEMKKLMMNIIVNVYDYYSSISYHDAYTFSLAYTLEMPEIKNAISSRFKYLFIDEMQDTDQHQKDIIEKVFDKQKTIIQQFGDNHQAIYHNRVSATEQWIPENFLPVNDSKRFGENIAKVLRFVCCEKNENLKANRDINSLPPVMIVFDKPENVLPKFCELIQSKEIDSKTIWSRGKGEGTVAEHSIKAIGWVGTESSPEKLTIKSYFPNFNRYTKSKEKVDYDSLKSFLKRQDGSNVKDYSNKIIEALLYILSTANRKYINEKTNRYYTRTTLLEDFENKSPDEFRLFNTNLAKWAKNIHNSDGFCNATVDEIKLFIISTFCTIFEVDSTNQYIIQFLNNQPTNIFTDEEIKSNNVFKYNGVEVEIATIHSVKGETHAATLYLETSYYGKHESQRIMEQLKGNYYIPSGKIDERKKETLKMAHVGMSRPKYFLCMAIHRERFDSSLDINNGGMWEIVNI